MLFVIFSIVLFIHSALHLIGFIKAIKPDSLPQIAMSISRPAGLLWFIASDFFLFTLLAYVFNVDWWWILSVPAILLSQTLIIVFWGDAKFGTAINIIIVLVAVVGYGTWSFNRMVEADFDSVKITPPAEKHILTEDKIYSLPSVIQRWLLRSGSIGREVIYNTFLMQKGEMRTEKTGNWMPFTAKQYFTTSNPAFIWTTEVQMFPGFFLAGRDLFKDGKGHMLIKLLSLAPVADSRGPEVDQGTMLRFMGEMVWLPTAALMPYLRWEEIDSVTAIGYMDYAGQSVKGRYTFTPEGDFYSLEAERYYSKGDTATLETWMVRTKPGGYKEFNGIRIPAKMDVTWRLKDGDFTWLNLEIKEIAYNKQLNSF